MSQHIQQAHVILSAAYNEYKPRTVIALTSWGNDSQVSTHIAARWAREHLPLTVNWRVATIHTGVAADGYVAWATEQARAAGYPWAMWHPEPQNGWTWYAQDVIKHGFGYTPSAHSLYYRILKERTLRRIRRAYRNLYGGRVMFVTGVFRDESSQRAAVPEYDRRGSEVWVNPLAYWRKADVTRYRIDNELPQNPFYKTTGGSGDCLCNWGQFVSFEDVQRGNPQLAAKLEPVHRECIAKHGWGYGERPSDGLLAERAGQMVLPTVEPLAGADLCAGCQRVKPGVNEAAEYRIMQEEWS
jgi:3'-phosphoadenosine 5'-phosphosulfate sulfotransferase (PAPS reductase)/FAD synthetase